MRPAPRMPIGYIRDRTAAYKEKWDALHPNVGAASHAAADRIGQAFGATDTTGLLSDDAAVRDDTYAVEMPPLNHNRLMQAEQEINRELQAAKADLATLSRLQSAAQEDLFGVNKGHQAQVDAKRTQLRESIRRIHHLIGALPGLAMPETRQVAERITRAKATALSEIASELNKQEIADLQAKAHKVPGMDHSGMDAVFSQLAEPTPAYTDQQMQQLSNIQQEYEQRDEAVAELIKEVTEIQEVMRDLSVLVVEQGSMVDRIDQNIVAAAAQVEQGTEQIRRAHDASKNGAMATCIFVLIIAIVIVFVILLIVKR